MLSGLSAFCLLVIILNLFTASDASTLSIQADGNMAMLQRASALNRKAFEAQHEQGKSALGSARNMKVTGGLGGQVPLDDNGFERIAGLRDTQEMRRFLSRALRKAGLIVSNEAGLSSFAEKCISGDGPHTYDGLSQELFGTAARQDGWVSLLRHDAPEFNLEQFRSVASPSLGPGLTQPLNEEGYQAVAKLRNAEEMNAFVHRVINNMGLEVKDGLGLLGVVPWYDGTNAQQSYKALNAEILSTALKPGTWVTVASSSV